jgi:hypothetical protein
LLIILSAILIVAGLVGVVIYLRWQATRDLDPSTATVGSVVNERDRAKLEAEEVARVAAYPADADGDGLSDEQETQLGTDANKADSDGDGFTDLIEVTTRRSDPKVFDETKADERPVYGTAVAEVEAGGTAASVPTPIPSTSDDDADQDGLLREQEVQLGTNPADADSDDDGVRDGDEVRTYRTNPQNRDSDADGYPDGDEIKNGYNPLGPGPCATSDCRP